jgi:hemerythrin
MPLIPWTVEFELGVPSIDQQHEHLMAKLNELHDAIVRGDDREMVGKLLLEGLRLTSEHFAYEEQLMAEQSWPGLSAHRHEHETLIKATKDLAHFFAAGGRLERHSIEVNIKEWWQKHLRGADKEFCTFLAAAPGNAEGAGSPS